MKKTTFWTLIMLFVASITFFSCGKKETKAQDNTTNVQTPNTSSDDGNNVVNTSSNTNQVQTNITTGDGEVIVLNTESFKEKVFDYSTNTEWKYNGTLPCVIDFYADWCRPCKMVAPIMEELAKEYNGKVIFYKMNVDNNQEVAQIFGIQSIPSVLFVPMNGKPQMAVGAMPKESYVKAINEVLGVK